MKELISGETYFIPSAFSSTHQEKKAHKLPYSAPLRSSSGVMGDFCEHSYSLWGHGGALGALTQPVGPRRSPVITPTACRSMEELWEYSHSLWGHGEAL